MEIEWDPAKERANVRKHGIRFAHSVSALEDERAVTIADESPEEERWIALGMDALARLLVIVDTWRGGCVRLISARLATPRERRQYGGE
jgi:uncharacterized DUF497 family protein